LDYNGGLNLKKGFLKKIDGQPVTKAVPAAVLLENELKK